MIGGLPRTGSALWIPVSLGILLVAVGLLIRYVSRQRR